ncbi:MAG: TraM recognition domain-containing protein [Flavobacteriaceae bacterium]|nr:MAG: TraM recognition domain-containing protein [Flavobacteriaceae bacterium]
MKQLQQIYPISIEHKTVQKWLDEYFNYNNSSAMECVKLGQTIPFHNLEFVVFFMEKWVDYYDNLYEKQSGFGYVLELASITALRGFKREELRLVFSNKTLPENYIYYRVFDYFTIIDKEAQNYFIAKYNREGESLDDIFLSLLTERIGKEIPVLQKVLFTPVTHLVPITSLYRHAYILGRSGSGKSELLKYLFYTLYQTDTAQRKSLCLLEPNSDLATQILQFHLNKDNNKKRVVYLDPFIRETAKKLLGEDIFTDDYTFVLNPFHIENATDRDINYTTQELSSAFFEILKSEATPQMNSIIQACIDVLLRANDTDITDLKRFMDDEENKDLIQLGKSNPNPERQNLISKKFTEDRVNPTKSGIYFRLQNIIDNTDLRSLLQGTSTINIEQEINNGKVILFNLSKGFLGVESSTLLGKLIVALIQGAVRKRQIKNIKDRVPTFFFIDEMQNYITKTIKEILAESRKYGLHLIMANQILGQGMDRELQRLILSNTAIKIAGHNDEDSVKAMAQQMRNITPNDFYKLEKYNFLCYDNTGEQATANVINVPDTLVNINPPMYMDKKELKAFFLWLVHESGYYVKKKKTITQKTAPIEPTTNDSNTSTIYNPNFEN